MLPGMDGLQLCQAIRRRSGYIPIIMVTAKDEDVDKGATISAVGSGETAVSHALILVKNAALPPGHAQVYQQLISGVCNSSDAPLAARWDNLRIWGISE